MRRSLMLAGVLAVLGLNGPIGEIKADDFRIETKVYAAKGKAPVSQTTTLFRAGVVYDYLADPPGTAVFDQPHGRFVLLNPILKLKTEVTTDQVLAFCAEMRNMAVSGPNRFLNFCGKPQFATEFDEANAELTMRSEFITYSIKTVPAKNLDAAHQIREFSDWYARLNAMINRGSTPPFARMEVNQELDKRGLLSANVELTIPPQEQLGGKGISMRSEHAVAWRLLLRDIDRISETGNQLANFKSVPFDKFIQPQVTAK
jgi:hypothetical protein